MQGNVNHTVDLLCGGRGSKICGVPLAASGLLGFVAPFGPTKGMGLAMGVAFGRVAGVGAGVPLPVRRCGDRVADSRYRQDEQKP